jgi:hypothetical protein
VIERRLQRLAALAGEPRLEVEAPDQYEQSDPKIGRLTPTT